jgi:hypothetical protein
MKKMTVLIAALLISLMDSSGTWAYPPEVQIIANEGNREPIQRDDSFTVDVAIDPGDETGIDADWWFLCRQGSKIFRFNLELDAWEETQLGSMLPTFQGALFPIEMSLSSNGLETLTTEFIFFVDTAMDGKIFGGTSYSASADMDVSSAIRQRDCRVIGIEQLENYGFLGLFEITLNFSVTRETDGGKIVEGQLYPYGWGSIAVENLPNPDLGKIRFEWQNGKPFEFAMGKESDNGTIWANPQCSAYGYPDLAEKATHLRVTLGTEEKCLNTTGDELVTSMENLGGSVFRIYLNFEKLPIANYQSLIVAGQSEANSSWTRYPVVDEFPCFYTEIFWPYAEFFNFSFGVVKKDGTEEWIDPTLSSKYMCGDHLCISPE